jgi:alanine racemase
VGVTIDLERVAHQAEEIRRRCDVALLAVVKADAYGLGAQGIAQAIHHVVDGFCVFSLAEAKNARLWEIGDKPILALRPEVDARPEDFLAAHVRPAVWDVEQAKRLRSARPVLCVDCGMQRFACPPNQIEAVLSAGACEEAFTHAINLDQVKQLTDLLGGRDLRLHAVGSALLDVPAARLNAVRPGLALYRGAANSGGGNAIGVCRNRAG